MSAIGEAVEAEIRRREAILEDPHGQNMKRDDATGKISKCKVSDIPPDYSGIEEAARYNEARDIRMACAALIGKTYDRIPNDTYFVNSADTLTQYVLTGKKPGEA